MFTKFNSKKVLIILSSAFLAIVLVIGLIFFIFSDSEDKLLDASEIENSEEISESLEEESINQVPDNNDLDINSQQEVPAVPQKPFSTENLGSIIESAKNGLNSAKQGIDRILPENSKEQNIQSIENNKIKNNKNKDHKIIENNQNNNNKQIDSQISNKQNKGDKNSGNFVSRLPNTKNNKFIV
ncbi:hypothetical protein [Candidatus Phytoplasma oryzae]|nr:hypothetical protein PIE28_00785 [Candidatus Phytoplasma oryzae]